MEKIKNDDMLLQERVCETRIKYGRNDVLRDEKENVIIEDESKKTEVEWIEENRHHEVYDPEAK